MLTEEEKKKQHANAQAIITKSLFNPGARLKLILGYLLMCLQGLMWYFVMKAIALRINMRASHML